MTLPNYEKIAGYKPVPGERCPSCKMVCGPGGPDHATNCALVAKLWAHEKNSSGASIPHRQMELGSDPEFQVWVGRLAGKLFS